MKSIDKGQQEPVAEYSLDLLGVARDSSPALSEAPARGSSPAPKSSSPVHASAISPESRDFSDGIARAQPTTTGDYPAFSQEQLQERYIKTNFACQRWSPLICINDDIIKELAVIKRGRKTLDGDDMSALSYGRAISAIKGYPWKITSKTKLTDLQGVGEKIERRVSAIPTKGDRRA